jgi:hypothetical protein
MKGFATASHLVHTANMRRPLSRPAAPLTWLVAAFVLLAVTYSLVTPILEGFDEHRHFAFVQYLATGHGLPRQPASEYPHLAYQEASQPPLYYWLAATLVQAVRTDDFAERLTLNPQFSAVPLDYADNQNILLHRPDEGWPFHDTPLAVHLARLLSVALGAGTLLACFHLGRALFPEAPGLPLAATALIAFTPSFVFVHSTINNDPLVIFLCALGLFALVHRWRSASQLWPELALGVLLGAAALSKLSGALLWIPAAFVFLFRPEGGKPARRALTLVRVFGSAGLICGWWYLRNWQLYGDPTGLNMMLSLMGHREPGYGLADVLHEFEGLRRSYWALLGQTALLLPAWCYRVLDILTALATVGAAAGLLRLILRRSWRRLALWGALLAWVALVGVGLVRWTLSTAGTQGRLLFPAIPAVSLLLVRGWWELLPRRIPFRRAFSGILTASLAALCIWIPWGIIRPAYAQPRWLAPEQASAVVKHPVGATFGNAITLLGYELDKEIAHPGEEEVVTLCWQKNAVVIGDPLIFVQILGEHDLIAAQKDTYPGLGSLPASQWPIGRAFCELYRLPIPDTAKPSTATTLAIGWYRSDGSRLPVITAGSDATVDHITVPGPALEPLPGGELDYEWGHRVRLIGYTLDTSQARPGESVALELHWQVLDPTRDDYIATVQVMDDQQNKIAQDDVRLGMALAPLGRDPRWITDRRALRIDPTAPPGVYHIRLGVYRLADLATQGLYRKGQSVPGALLSLWHLRVAQ